MTTAETESDQPVPSTPASTALRARVLSEVLGRMSGNDAGGDSATEQLGAATIRATLAEILADMQPVPPMPEPETTPPATRVEVDLNVRANGGQARVGFEDADGPLQPGQVVEVFESESGLTGVGTVTAINTSTRLAWIAVDWPKLAEPDTKIRAPWTPEQVAALNAFQQHGGMHPFTCGNERHDVHYVLIARADGWHCSQPPCDYRQDWAHAFMAEPRTTSGEGLRGLLEHVGIDLTGKTITIADGPTIAELHERNARTALPVPGLRDQIAGALLARIKQAVIIDPGPFSGMVGQPFAATEYDLADAVLAVVQPVIDDLTASRADWKALADQAKAGWDEAQQRAEAMERAMEDTAADALKHRGCHRSLMGQVQRAETAEAALARVRDLHDRLTASDGLTDPEDAITRAAAARRIAAALDGYTPPVPADQPEGGEQ